MQSIAIILLCISSAIFYGIIHDQITARICVEYFTIGHPPVFGTNDPTLLGLGWGVIATWWVGLMLGVPLVISARAGSRRKRDARSLVRPIAILMAVMATSATIAGTIGWLLADHGAIAFVVLGSVRRLPAEKEAAFIADAFAHNASYFIGFVGGLVVIAKVWRSRRDPRETPRLSGLND